MSIFRLILLLLPGLALLPGTAFAQTLAEQVLERTNIARWQNGQLPPLKGNLQLDAAALGHSTRMGVHDFFMHCDPDTGKTFGVRIADAGYGYSSAAENIAAGSSTAAGVMTQWMESSGHRANILGSYNELGVGYYLDANDGAAKRYTNVGGCTPNTTLNGNFRHYWTQNFGRRNGNYPLVIEREAWRTESCDVDLYVYGSGFATQMRFSNNGGANWSPWRAYAADTGWTLAGAGNTLVTVNSEIRNGAGSVRSASDSIVLGQSCALPDPMRIFRHGFD